jgi:hypothetical protein
MNQLFMQLPALLQAIILLTFVVVAVCTVLSGITKALGWQKATAFLSSLGQDFGKAGAVLRGYQPVNKPDQLPEVPKAP